MPAVFRHGPFGLDAATPLQAMQRRVKRALLDAQHVLGNLLNALRNGPAVLRFKRQRLEDQQVERSLREIDTLVCHKLPFHFYNEHIMHWTPELQGKHSGLSHISRACRQGCRENYLDLHVNLALQKVIMVYVFASSKMEAQPVLGLASKVTRSEDTPAIVEQNGNRFALIVTGMGVGNARAKAEVALGLAGAGDAGGRRTVEKPEAILVIGLCGGLKEAMREGRIVAYTDCLSAGNVSPLRCSPVLTNAIVESLQSQGITCDCVTGITSPRIASGRSERLALAESGASGVDMESYEILSAAARAEVPAAVLRVVSDSLDANMPDFNPALDANGGLNGRKALGIALGSPLKTIRLISANKRAMGRLTPAVRGILQSNCFSVLKSSAGH